MSLGAAVVISVAGALSVTNPCVLPAVVIPVAAAALTAAAMATVVSLVLNPCAPFLLC